LSEACRDATFRLVLQIEDIIFAVRHRLEQEKELPIRSMKATEEHQKRRVEIADALAITLKEIVDHCR